MKSRNKTGCDFINGYDEIKDVSEYLELDSRRYDSGLGGDGE